jgi:hypothetical protein
MSVFREKIIFLLIIAALLIALFALVIACSFSISIKKINSEIKEDTNLTNQDREIANKVKNSLVHLWGVGTGFIYKEDEKNIYILTNKHVIDLYDLQKHENLKIFGNKIYLPYIKFIDQNIQYKENIQSQTIHQEKFSKQKYLDDIKKNIKNNLIDQNLFGKFATHEKYDLGIIAIPKSSLNIAQNTQIQTLNFSDHDPAINEKVYLCGNNGGRQSSPLLYKGKITEEYNPFILSFTDRDEVYVKSNAKLPGGLSGAPEFNSQGNVVGIGTLSNEFNFRIPWTDYEITISGNSTYCIKNSIVMNSLQSLEDQIKI